MNCKPGDLAVIVRGSCAGFLVTVIRPPASGERFVSVDKKVAVLSEKDRSPGWVCESAAGPMPWALDNGETWMFRRRPVADSRLRPIRDNDGEDETLTWAPWKVKA